MIITYIFISKEGINNRKVKRNAALIIHFLFWELMSKRFRSKSTTSLMKFLINTWNNRNDCNNLPDKMQPLTVHCVLFYVSLGRSIRYCILKAEEPPVCFTDFSIPPAAAAKARAESRNADGGPLRRRDETKCGGNREKASGVQSQLSPALAGRS